LRSIRVDSPEQVDAAWAEAFAADRPCLLEAIVDPDVPLLPPRLPDEKVDQC
jgi:pyruvate dehydrogenase (quinone)